MPANLRVYVGPYLAGQCEPPRSHNACPNPECWNYQLPLATRFCGDCGTPHQRMEPATADWRPHPQAIRDVLLAAFLDPDSMKEVRRLLPQPLLDEPQVSLIIPRTNIGTPAGMDFTERACHVDRSRADADIAWMKETYNREIDRLAFLFGPGRLRYRWGAVSYDP